MLNPKDLLSHFNISEQESTIYLALLSLGKTGATQIAKKTRLNRTAVYFHLNHLVEKKLIHQVRSGKIIKYVAAPPRDVADQFERWTTDFKSLVPWMESLNKIETETPRISISETKSGYYQVYDEISSLPHGSMIRLIEGREAVLGEFSALPEAHWRAFLTRMTERKIETKALLTTELTRVLPGSLNKQNQALLEKRIWHLRLLPEKLLPFQKLLIIYGRRASFIFPGSSIVVTIDHRELVETLICLFDGLYQFGTPASRP